VTSPTGRAAQVGESVVFTITVANTGDVPIVTIPVEDRYSTNILSFVAPAAPATVDTSNDGILNWADVGPLAVGRAPTCS